MFTADLKAFAEKENAVNVKTTKKRKIKLETTEEEDAVDNPKTTVVDIVENEVVIPASAEGEALSLADRIKRRRRKA